MSQIYVIASELILKERCFELNKTNSSFNISFENKWKNLSGNEKAFIATMVAMKPMSKDDSIIYNVVFHMKPEWFMSKMTYIKTKKQLIDKHAIAKFKNSRWRYVLNPEFHPNLSPMMADKIANQLKKVWIKQSKQL